MTNFGKIGKFFFKNYKQFGEMFETIIKRVFLSDPTLGSELGLGLFRLIKVFLHISTLYTYDRAPYIHLNFEKKYIKIVKSLENPLYFSNL